MNKDMDDALTRDIIRAEGVGSLMKLLIDYFGSNCWDDSTMRTAERILGYWAEFQPQEMEKLTVFDCPHQEMIAIVGIEFTSLCAHHLLPFYGVAHVGYLPHKLMIGASKIPRIVDHYSKQPQTQERLTHQIGDLLKEHLEAKGVAVVLVATHTCMACRGVRKRWSKMVTSYMRGSFLTDPSPRQEFMQLVAIGGQDGRT